MCSNSHLNKDGLVRSQARHIKLGVSLPLAASQLLLILVGSLFNLFLGIAIVHGIAHVLEQLGVVGGGEPDTRVHLVGERSSRVRF